MLVFRPSFVNYCPTSLLSGSTPSVSKYSMYRQCVTGRGWRCWVLLETIFFRSLTLCIWPDSEPTKLLDYTKLKPRWEGGLRQINTSCKVPLQVNFFRWRHLALLSISLLFLRYYPLMWPDHQLFFFCTSTLHHYSGRPPLWWLYYRYIHGHHSRYKYRTFEERLFKRGPHVPVFVAPTAPVYKHTKARYYLLYYSLSLSSLSEAW